MLTACSRLRGALIAPLALAATLIAEPVHGADEALASRVAAAVDADAPRLIALYKDLHQRPELAFMEVRTAGVVAEQLGALGYEVKTGIGVTGVVGVLDNGPGPTLMFRADMDAIPQAEATGLPYASDTVVTLEDGSTMPAAHLCGHDLHTTWMLGVAKVLAEARDAWSGRVVFVAQPAEETISGARAMVEDGLYTTHGTPKPDYFLAAHTFPVSTGFVAAPDGLLMAGTEVLDATFHGVGGHGSTPHLAKDPIVMAAMAIVQYQTIVSRFIDPRKTAVVTVGAINAGTVANVIPPTARLKINIRFFEPEVRDQLVAAIQRINESVARAHGVPEDQMPTLESRSASTPLSNRPEASARVAAAVDASGVLGTRVVTKIPPVTGSEDAHLLVAPVPAANVLYMAIGVAPPEMVKAARAAGKPFPFWNHEPTFQVDLDAVGLGAKVLTVAALELLRAE